MDSCCGVIVMIFTGIMVLFFVIGIYKESEEFKQKFCKEVSYTIGRLNNRMTYDEYIATRSHITTSFSKLIGKKIFIDKMNKLEEECQWRVCNYIVDTEDEIIKILQDYFKDGFHDFNSTLTLLKGDMQKINNSYNGLKNMRVEHSRVETAESLPASINTVKMIVDSFERYRSRIRIKNIIFTTSYGKISESYLDEVKKKYNKDSILKIISSWESNLKNNRWLVVLRDSIDAEMARDFVWYIATQKPFDTDAFGKCVDLLERVTSHYYIQNEIIFSNLIALYNIGGEDAVKEKLNDIIRSEFKKQSPDYLSKNCQYIASGLMWLKAYDSEKYLLSYLLSNQIPMSEVMQKRLHILSANSGDTPDVHNVVTKKDLLYFDISSNEWNDNSFIGLFDSLEMENSKLNYSLSLRSGGTELLINKGYTIPNVNQMVDELNKEFKDEYGEDVSASMMNCIALSGAGEENIKCILIKVNKFNQFGILMNTMQIGKKIIIKFYTLFMPSSVDTEVQKQQVLSLKNQLSPAITAWEESIKETSLIVVQKILNSNIYARPDEITTVEQKSNIQKF